jgi:hypothetical protein
MALGLAAGSPLGGALLAAQEPPRAEDILDREAAALGGKELNQKVKTVVIKLKVALPDQQLGVILYHAGPTRQCREVSVEGLGKEETVVSGELAWKTDSITGSRLLQGAERAQALAEADEFADVFRRVGTWRQQVKQARYLGEEKVAGKLASKLQVTTRQGLTRIDHYDRESGLLVRREVTVESPQGKVNEVAYFSDYRKVDGIAHAFTTRMVRGPAELVLRIDQIEHNVDIPAERFALPAELRKLQKQP